MPGDGFAPVRRTTSSRVSRWPASAVSRLRAGRPVGYLERGAKHLLTFGADPDEWLEPLAELVKDGRLRALTLERIDNVPTRESPAADALRTAGFVPSYRGLRLGA